MRLLPVLTGALLLVALVGAGNAHAHHLNYTPASTNPVYTTGTGGAGTYKLSNGAWTKIVSRTYSPADPGWGWHPTGGSQTIEGQINKMQRKGRVLPALRTLGSMGMALSIGWTIGNAAGPTVYKLIAGSDPLGTTGGTPVPLWTFETSFSPANGGGFTLVNGWRYNSQAQGWGAGYYCSDGSDCGGLQPWGLYAASALAAGLPSTSQHLMTSTGSNTTPCGTGAGSGVPCKLIYRTEAQMDDARHMTNTDAAGAAAAGVQVSSSYDAPGDLGTDADKTAASDALGAPGAQTADQKLTEEAIACDLDPTGCEDTNPHTFVLPVPNANETYAAYVTRLQGLGWLGTATSTVLSSALSGYGPEAVARVTYSFSGTTTTLEPLNWPSPAPTITTSTNLTIRYNPTTAAPAPTTPAPTPVTPPATTVPTGGGVDFGPITDLDPGCKFPYGLLCYAVDVSGWFNVTPDAPAFTFDIPSITVAGTTYGGGEDEWVVDLNVMDSFMAVMRTLIAVVLWIGGVYFLAASLLGFRAGGDPGEAADEALHV